MSIKSKSLIFMLILTAAHCTVNAMQNSSSSSSSNSANVTAQEELMLLKKELLTTQIAELKNRMKYQNELLERATAISKNISLIKIAIVQGVNNKTPYGKHIDNHGTTY